MSSPRRDQTRWWTEEMEATSGEAHKGRERGRWAAAGRDHEIGDLEISEGGCGSQYTSERGKVQQDRYHGIFGQHRTSKGTPTGKLKGHAHITQKKLVCTAPTAAFSTVTSLFSPNFFSFRRRRCGTTHGC